MPEIAEREPKVISGGLCHFSCSDLRSTPCGRGPLRAAASGRKLGAGGVGAEEMVLFTPS